ncbi:MAG: TatD family hydrolase, partial [Gracilibacteraceae bacterium]|nr:TatD family hydrolase [Gracilibacteraceae bacterium]
MIWDTHAHLNSPRFDADRAEALARARAAGVTRIVNIGFDEESSLQSVALAEEHDDIYAAIGVHPHDAEGAGPAVWARLRDLA